MPDGAQGNQAEQVEILVPSLPPGGQWQPKEGAETLAVLARFTDLDDLGRAKVRDEAATVLGKCESPDKPDGQTTGLVLGQVQSGKTMSFTTVAALARDNGYRMVIAITGTTTSLLGQSAGRLRRDLGIEHNNRAWSHVPVLPALPLNRTALNDILDEWRDPAVALAEKQTVLITVMKQHRNLSKLNAVLATLNLDDVPTLVIDDEGDQASLNTKVRSNAESTTYRQLVALKGLLPRHTFLQYTATPQAPLLINIIDALSPTFAELLTPGSEYTGGRAFFIDHPELVREIPAGEVPTRQVPLNGPPESLFAALRLFFLGVSATLLVSPGEKRSMLVHPSVTRNEHAQFHQWVTLAKDEWKETLARPESDPDRRELVDEFRMAEQDLRATVPDLPPFGDLVARLPTAIRRTRVEKVNAAGGTTPTVPWNDADAFILVGGQAMDRGYTVRGLTVTYMPRGLGKDAHADTVQQRARFFGYKRSYLAYCRVYLEAGVLEAFREYVEHEEDVRERLTAFNRTGRALSDWPRAFLLDIALKPTRDNVIDVPYQRQRLGEGWFIPNAPHENVDAAQANRELVGQIATWATLEPDPGHADRSEFQRHFSATGLRLRDLYERLLSQFRHTRFEDSQAYVGLLLLIRRVMERDGTAPAALYLMSQGRPRVRTVDDDGNVPALFQGEAPVMPKSKRGSVYPGDVAIRQDDAITVQVHTLDVRDKEGRTLAVVPAVAVWVPGALGKDLVIQAQGVHS